MHNLDHKEHAIFGNIVYNIAYNISDPSSETAFWMGAPRPQIGDFLTDSVDTFWHAACLFRRIAL